MELNIFKTANIRKATLLISFFVFLLFGLEIFAAECNLDGWNNNDCTVDIYYVDPTGGSDLDGCYYTTESGTSPTCPTDGSWDPACYCKGEASITCPVTISVGPAGDCNINGEGACKICSKAVDGAGNAGYGELSLNIDYASPETAIECNGTICSAGWYNADISITLFCSDSDSGCDETYYCIDQTNSCSPGTLYIGAFNLSAEGTNYVRYYSTDTAGNVEPTNSKTIKLDKTGPISQFTDVATPPAGSTVTTDFDVSVDDWDRPLGTAGVDNSGLASCYYSVYDSGVGWTKSGETRNCSSDLSFTVTVSPTGDCRTIGGTCTVSVYAYDAAGNPGDGQSRTFNIASADATPPTVWVIGAPASWQNTDAQASVGCSDTDSGCDTGSYKLKTYTSAGSCSTVYSDYTLISPQTISSNLWLCAAAKDLAGNEGFSPTRVEFKVDKEKPASQITSPPADSEQTEDFSVSVSDTDTGGSGLNVCYYRTYDSVEGWTRSWTTRTCNSNQLITVSPTGDCRTIGGTCTVSVYAYDAAGNLGDGQSRTFNIAAPTHTLNISSTSGGSVTDPGEGTFTYNEGEVVSLVATPDTGYHFLNWTGDTGTIADVNSASTTITMDSDKTVNATFVLNQAPQLDSISVSPDYVKQGDTITVNSIASDPDDDQIRLECGNLTESNDLCISNYTLTNPSCFFASPWSDNTTHTIYCRAYDGELYSEERTDTITSDNTGPIIGDISPTEAVKDQSQTYTFPVSDVSGADSCVLQYVDGNFEGLDITLSDIPCQDCTASFSYTFFETGLHTFQVMCDDLVDNATGRIFEIEVSEFGPLICNINVLDTAVINQWIEINVSGSQGAIVEVRFASNLIGEPTGSWTDWYDWDASSGGWDAFSETMKWSFAEAGNYEVWAEISDGTETASCYDTITIFECYPGQEDTCISGQGCSHTIICKPDGTWPACPEDECIRFTENDPHCPLCPEDRCVGPDWYDYPYYGITDRAYGDCNSECQCNTGTETGQPCEPNIEINSPNCSGITENCFNNIDDDGDGLIDCQDPDCPPTISCDICNHLECNALGNYDWTCQPDPAGTDCGNCKECDGAGNCLYLCVGDGDETSCECIVDECIDCSDYYDGGCGYQGICFCGDYETPVWSCLDGKCQCECIYNEEECGFPPPECTRKNPEVYITPISKEGAAGETLTYTVWVTNQDQGTECGFSTFSLAAGGYCNEPGWSCSDLPNLTIDIGQSDFTTLSVISPPDAPKGDKDISVTAQNSGLPEFFGTGYATYEVLNNPPSAINLSATPEGICFLIHPFVELSWTFDDPDLTSGDYQSAREVEIFSDSGYTNLVNSIPQPDYSPGSTEYTPNAGLSFNADYYWRVRVWDNEGALSDCGHPEGWCYPEEPSFRTEKEWPWPDFSVVPPTQRVHLKEKVEFTDESICYDRPCNLSPSANYLWEFGDGETSAEQGNTSHVYFATGNYDVTLTITDEVGNCTSDPITITVTRPLPEWMEIPPF